MAGENQPVTGPSPERQVEVYPPPAPRLRQPLILAHGLFGFDQVSVLGKPVVNYFAGVPAWLRATGNQVHVSRVAPMGPIAHRAGQLVRFIERHTGEEPVHIIAHSMGGLDSRYAISRLGLGDRVLSLTTLGTPHRGTVIADRVLGWTRMPPGLEHWLRRFGADVEALRDLARPAMARILGPLTALSLYKLDALLPFVLGGMVVLCMLPLMPRIRQGGQQTRQTGEAS